MFPMRVLALLVAKLLGVGAALAQPMPPRTIPICGGMFGFCGLQNYENKQWVIPQQYERISLFSEGLAAVRIKGKFGFINDRNEIVIAPRFDLAGSFFQGLAEVLVGDKTGVIDRKGNFVVEPQFERSLVLTNDVLLVRDGIWRAQSRFGFGDEELRTLADTWLLSGARWSLYHTRNGPILRNLNLQSFDKSGRGLIWAQPPGDLWGLLRTNGTWQVEPQYAHVQPLLNDRAIVGKRIKGRDHFGAVDADGNLLVALRRGMLTPWRDGFSQIEDGDKTGLIDKAGNLLGGRMFDGVARGKPGEWEHVFRVLVDDKWVGLDRSGNLVAHPDDGKVVSHCPSGLQMVLKSGKVQIVGADGKPTIPHSFDNRYETLRCDRPTLVSIGRGTISRPTPKLAKYSFIGTDGRLLFEPMPFSIAYEFEGDFAIVARDGKRGIIDTSGKFTVAPRFQYLTRQGEGLYRAYENGRTYWINGRGEEQPAPKPRAHTTDERTKMLDCAGGAKIVSVIDQTGTAVWGIADASGREIIKPQYRAIHCFRNGVAWAPIDAKRKWCPIDPDGSVREAPACVEMRYSAVSWFHSFHPEQLDNDPYESSVLFRRAHLEFGAGRRAEPPRWSSSSKF